MPDGEKEGDSISSRVSSSSSSHLGPLHRILISSLHRYEFAGSARFTCLVYLKTSICVTKKTSMGRSWGLFTRDDHARTMLWKKGNGEFIPGMEMARLSSGVVNLTVSKYPGSLMGGFLLLLSV